MKYLIFSFTLFYTSISAQVTITPHVGIEYIDASNHYKIRNEGFYYPSYSAGLNVSYSINKKFDFNAMYLYTQKTLEVYLCSFDIDIYDDCDDFTLNMFIYSKLIGYLNYSISDFLKIGIGTGLSYVGEVKRISYNKSVENEVVANSNLIEYNLFFQLQYIRNSVSTQFYFIPSIYSSGPENDYFEINSYQNIGVLVGYRFLLPSIKGRANQDCPDF